jgi:16S rRNA processing protein RimM
MPPARTLALGVVGRPHGVRGELVFHPFNPAGARLEELPLPLVVELRPAAGPPRPATLATARPFKDRTLVSFQGLGDRDAAAALTRATLSVPRAVLPPLGEGEFYVADLVGLAVEDGQGAPLGTVAGAYWNGTQDVLRIEDPRGGERLIPVVPAFVRTVDTAGGRLVVDAPPEGDDAGAEAGGVEADGAEADTDDADDRDHGDRDS